LVALAMMVALMAGCGGGGGGSSTGSVVGQVFDDQTLAPIAGASVKVGTAASVVTNSSGAFTVSGLSSGSQSVTISATGYGASVTSVTVGTGTVSAGSIYLKPGAQSGKGNVTGQVLSGSTPIGGAIVSAGGASGVTKADGRFTLYNLTPGAVTVSASSAELSGSTTTTVVSGSTVSVTVFVSIAPPPPPPI
jgi:hypothetical protein